MSTSPEYAQGVSFGVLTAELLLGQEKIADALPVLVHRDGITFRPYVDTLYLNVEIPLDARRLEVIEKYRNGKSFIGCVHFRLGATAFGVSNSPEDIGQMGLKNTSCIDGQVHFTVPDTQWREKILPGLGYGKVLAIELPAIQIKSFERLEHSFKALEQAQKQFQLGHYDDAVGKCRVALDQFFEQVDKGDGSGKKIPKLKKSWETKLGQSTYRWLDESLGAIKTAANKPHHSPNIHFDRLEAQMLIMVTIALISYAASQDG